MSRDIAVFLIQKICSVIELQKDTSFPCKSEFQTLKTKLEEIERTLGADTSEEHDKLRDKLYDLDDLLLECLALSGKQSSSMISMVTNCTPLRFRNLNTRFRNLKSDIEVLSKKREERVDEEVKPETEERSEEVKTETEELSEEEEETYYEYTTSYVDESRIFGLVEDADKIAERISESEKFTATAIVGICGSGKTALAQKVFIHDKMMDKFPRRLWFCVGPECKKDELLYRMLDNLGVDVEEVMKIIEETNVVKTKTEGVEKQQSRIGVLTYILYQQLFPMGYLIVFDDVREDEDPKWYKNLTAEPPMEREWFERFAYGLPKVKDSAVIVTCRREEFAREMVDTGLIFPVNRLDKDVAWLLFRRSFEEAMKKKLEKDKKKMEKEKLALEGIEKEIEDKSKKLKETNDEMPLSNEIERIKKDLEERNKKIKKKEKELEETEKKLKDNDVMRLSNAMERIKIDWKEIEEKNNPKLEELGKELAEAEKKLGELRKDSEVEKGKSEETSTEKEISAQGKDTIAGLEEKKRLNNVKAENLKRSEENVNSLKETISKLEREKETIKKKEEEMEQAKQNIRDKCLGLPIALIEAAKGLVSI